MNNRFAGKVAFISGAASGIGLETAKRFAREGGKVALADRDEKSGSDALAKLTEAGPDACFIALDVVDPDGWRRAIDTTLERWGRLDVLVNSAGVARRQRLLDMTLEDWRFTNAVNLDGTFLGTQAAVRAMASRRSGAIINLSSIMGSVGHPYLSAYVASKGGVRLFSKAIALECQKEGLNIRVNTVHPGHTETPMVMNAINSMGGDRETMLDELTETYPTKRLGQPAEIASMILYLASDEASFITGAEFHVDGGYTAG
ncbi:MAG: glucose 1-dehydrogenase [Pseudomonadota bacterium]